MLQLREPVHDDYLVQFVQLEQPGAGDRGRMVKVPELDRDPAERGRDVLEEMSYRRSQCLLPRLLWTSGAEVDREVDGLQASMLIFCHESR